MAYPFRRENKGTSSFTGVYEGRDSTRRSAGPSRRDGLAPRSSAQRSQGRDGSDGTCTDPDHEKYLHTLPDTDQKNLDALMRMTGRSVRDRMN